MAAYGVLLALTCAGLWLPRLRGPLDLRWDGGVYYILGTSLAEGRGLRLLNEPGAIQAVQYPPLLPLLVAVHVRLSGTSDPTVVAHRLRLSYCALFFLYCLSIFAVSRRFLTSGYAFLVALVSIVQLHTVFLSDLLFAELPFGALTMWFLWEEGREAGSGKREAGSGRRPPPDALPALSRPSSLAPRPYSAAPLPSPLSLILVPASFLLRTVGLALLAAWVGESLLRRQWGRAATRAVVAALPVLGWQLYVAHVTHGEEYARPAYAYQRAPYLYYNVTYQENYAYIDPDVPEAGRISATTLVRRVGRNLLAVPSTVGEAVSAARGWWLEELLKVNRALRLLAPVALSSWLPTVAVTALGTLSLLGLILLARQGEYLIPLYAFATFALIALNPMSGQFARYLSPLTPVLALSLFRAVGVGPAPGRRAGVARAPRAPWKRAGARTLLAATVATVLLVEESFVLWKAFSRNHQPAVGFGASSTHGSFRLFFYDESWRQHDTALEWLARHSAPGEIVATQTPHLAYLRTGLPAIMPPFEARTGVAESLLEEVPATYLVLDKLTFSDVTSRYAAPFVRAFPERWQLIYSSPDSGSRIYRTTGKREAGSDNRGTRYEPVRGEGRGTRGERALEMRWVVWGGRFPLPASRVSHPSPLAPRPSSQFRP